MSEVEFNTCGYCRKPMRFNVPHLGPNGGYCHAITGKLGCETEDLTQAIIALQSNTPRSWLQRLLQPLGDWVGKLFFGSSM